MRVAQAFSESVPLSCRLGVSSAVTELNCQFEEGADFDLPRNG